VHLLLGLALAAPPQAVQVWVEAPTQADREELAELGADFAEGSDGARVLVQLRPQDLERLPARFGAQRVQPPAGLAEHFHDPDEVEAELRRLALRDGVELVRVGESVEGRALWALRMGNPEGPRWRVLGAHHGDEASSSELALAVAAALLEEPAWQGLLEELEVWILPVVNPDGLLSASRNNANGVDLNRNYAHQWRDSVFSGEAPFTEPEVRAIRAYSSYLPPTLGLSVHSGAQNIGYPWNYTRTDTPEEAGLLALGETYGQACAQPDFYVTNGADWYITYGDTNDWSLAAHGVWDFTLEISDTKSPDASGVESALGQHLPAVLALLEQAPRAHGRVTDAETGRPLEARLSLDRDSSPWVSDPVSGRWWRPLDTGVYSMRVEAPGYVSQDLELRVHASDDSQLDVQLLPGDLQEAPLSPSLVSRAEDQVLLQAPGDPDSLMLSRPGFDPVEVERTNQGLLVDTSKLEAGPWTVSTGTWTRPRGLLVSDPGGTVSLQSVSVDGRIELRGSGFGEGSLAWLLYGSDRALEPIEVLSESPSLLTLDGSSLPAEGTVDLLVLSNGSELAVTDLLGAISLDTSMPTPDTADTASPPAGAPADIVGYRGCQTTGSSGPWMLALALAIALADRRRTRCR
jgi:hypothetical protein